MTLLHIDTSLHGSESVTRQLSAEIVARLRSTHPERALTYRDLGDGSLPHLTGPILAGMRSAGADDDPKIGFQIALAQTILSEFLAAETVVIGVPFYNFTIPSPLKAWIDRILIVGQTFRYTPEGFPEGLVGDKRVVLAIARGGFYGAGTPTAVFEHAETYLRTAFGFIGISNLEVVVAEGLAIGTAQRVAAIADARSSIAVLQP